MSSSSSTLPPQLAKIVERFQRRSNPKQKYEQLLWYAKKLPAMPESGKTEENKVQLVKGLVAFLIEGLNNLPPEEIIQVEPNFIEDTGLKVSLTPSRANGFFNIFQMMKKKALGFHLGTAEIQDN